MFLSRVVLALITVSMFPLVAAAQVAELRFGISQFDEELFDFDGDPLGRADETSAAITGEVLFEEPKFLKWALSPQPYIGGSLNLEGNTSFGGGGLLWRQTVGKKLYGDFALGLVAHTGTLEIGVSDELTSLLDQANEFDTVDDIPMELIDALNVELDDLFERENTEIEFGSRVLFRLQLAIGYNISKDWASEVYIEHLSNGRGNIFGEDVNEGVNNIGFRAVRKF